MPFLRLRLFGFGSCSHKGSRMSGRVLIRPIGGGDFVRKVAMRRVSLWLVFFVVSSSIRLPSVWAPPGDYPITAVPFTDVHLEPGFWWTRVETNRGATVPHILRQCDVTGRIHNFLKAAGQMEGYFEGWWFNDSDVYKSIEAAAYSLLFHTDPELERSLDEIIAKIAAAQEPDGYLFTPRRTLAPHYRFAASVGPERWSRLESSHELYCLGHLFEAAVAHYQATGKRSLLEVAIRGADLLDRVFGPEKKRAVPGHQEVELGLVKLYRVTKDERYLRLAKFFLDERGRAHGRRLYGTYSQDHKPVVEQEEAVGHAVRALYMYMAMADIVAVLGDPAYARALGRLWTDVVGRKMYVTGGIGAAGGHEGFGAPYELPNLTAYCETCAAIAFALWNHRMFLLSGEGKYIDVLERVLYNGVLSGVSLDGRAFFYPNPLESDGRHARSSWFAVACCPPNVARFLFQVPGLAYAHRGDQLYVNLFMASRATVRMTTQTVTLVQSTSYPWQGEVTLTLDPERPERAFTLLVRIPGWARNEAVPGDLYRFAEVIRERPTLRVNGYLVAYTLQHGYVSIRRRWRKGDVVKLSLPMPVRRVVSHPKVEDNIGKVALQRGPIVYCVEWPDVPGGHVVNLVLSDAERLHAEFQEDMFGGISLIRGTAVGLRCVDPAGRLQRERVPFLAIPYYAWAHRGRGEMAVWLAREESAARPLPCPTIAFRAKASASGGDPRALNDQREPRHSADRSNRYLHWWPRKGTIEWVQYDFGAPTRVSAVEVYWYDDTGIGECRVPKSWELFYRENGEWKPVRNPSGYGLEKDRYNRTTFDPVITDGLRLIVRAQENFCAGIHEWRVR
jgi:DUF1680 family protein